MNKRKIGILDKGEDTEIIDCEFHGFDMGIKTEGKRLKSKRNKFFTYLSNNKWYEIWWLKYIFFPIIVGIIIIFVGIFVNKL